MCVPLLTRSRDLAEREERRVGEEVSKVMLRLVRSVEKNHAMEGARLLQSEVSVELTKRPYAAICKCCLQIRIPHSMRTTCR